MKRIQGLENYAVTKTGSVFNVKRRKLLRASCDGNYLFVTLSDNGKRYFPKVHRLVAEAFIPKPSEDHNYVNHKNLDKTDNSVGNLEWVTASENMIHAYKFGAYKSSNKSKRLTIEDAETIRKRYSDGVSSNQLSNKFSVTQRHIQRILNHDFLTTE